MTSRICCGVVDKVSKGSFYLPTLIVKCNTVNVGWKSNTRLFHGYVQLTCKQSFGKTALFTHQKYSRSATDKDLGTEVYSGPLAHRIRSVKLFSLATSLLGLLVQPMILQQILQNETSIALVIFSASVIQFFTFITPGLLHYITKRYVRSLYYNPGTGIYTALVYNFWAADRLLPFKADDVIIPEIPGMFTSVIVSKTPLFLEASHFRDINHYKRIMGFEKPIDFKMEERRSKP